MPNAKIPLKKCIGGIIKLGVSPLPRPPNETKRAIKRAISRAIGRESERGYDLEHELECRQRNAPDLDACVARLTSMPPLEFNDQLRALQANLRAGTISETLLKAFREVEPVQRPRIEASLAARDDAARRSREAAAAGTAAAATSSDDEKKVAAGTHHWVCERQKCGGKGQTIPVWTLVASD